MIPISNVDQFFFFIVDKPIFMKPRHSSIVRLTEGDVFSVSYEAHANPPSITYYWTKDEKLVGNYARGSSLTIPKVKRGDAGVYTCEARNSEGSEKQSVELNVQCKNAKLLFVTTSFLNQFCFTRPDTKFRCFNL